MLRTAIDLKEAIENVECYTTPIGSCPLDVWGWQVDERGNGVEGGTLETTSELVSKISKSLKSKYYHTCQVQGEITIGDYTGKLDIGGENLQTLFDGAEAAPYGDLNTLETVVNEEVRMARDIKDFTVGSDIIKQIQTNWKESGLYPPNVKVVPYKINLYGKDGHFDLHQDTPGKDMVGTALVALSDNCYNGGALKVWNTNKTENKDWYCRPKSCIMFYTDCPHQVSKLQIGIRATVAFKIYHDRSMSLSCDGPEQLMVDQVVGHIQTLESHLGKTNGYGFVLGHGYSLHTATLKGSDQIITNALNQLGRNYTIVPIVHRWNVFSFHGECGDEEDEEATSKVYPFRDGDIESILAKQDIKKHELGSDIQFYRINGDDYVWKSEHQNFCEHVGNEAQPEEQNSIYLNRVIIIN